MQPDPKSENAKQLGKSRVFFTIGFIFLFLMALFWSLDASVVYILLGLTTFFLFMGFYARPRQRNPSQSYQKSYSSIHNTEKTPEKISDLLSSIFSKKTSAPNASYGSPTAVTARRRVVGLVMVSVFILFIVVLVSIVFSSDDYTSYDAIGYYETAERNYGAGNYDSASINYRKAWKLDPDYAEAIFGYANVLAVKERYDSAQLVYDRVLELRPDYKEASYGKAWIYYSQGKYDEAINYLNDLLQRNGDYYDAMLLLGDSYYEQKNFDAALPWYENAYENGGARSRMLCHIMAYIYDTKTDYQSAIPLYKEALTYDSTVVDIYTRLGELIPGEEGNYYRTQAAKFQTR